MKHFIIFILLLFVGQAKAQISVGADYERAEYISYLDALKNTKTYFVLYEPKRIPSEIVIRLRHKELVDFEERIKSLEYAYYEKIEHIEDSIQKAAAIAQFEKDFEFADSLLIFRQEELAADSLGIPYSSIMSYKKALRDIWDITDIDVITYDQYASKAKSDSCSFFLIDSYFTQDRPEGLKIEHHHLSLVLNKNSKRIVLAKSALHAKESLLNEVDEPYPKIHESNKELYAKRVFSNYHVGFVKTTLAEIHRCIVNAEQRKMDQQVTNNMELQQLKYNTLLIPFLVFTPLDLDYSKNKKMLKKLNKEVQIYPFDTKFVNNDPLSNSIEIGKDTLYYLCVVQFGEDIYLSIVEGMSSRIIYARRYKGTEIKEEYIEELSRNIN